MEPREEPDAMVEHFKHLAADADDLMALLNRQHDAGGELHPTALPKAARLKTSLHAVVEALTHHEHLAAKSDDVWRMLSREHQGREV